MTGNVNEKFITPLRAHCQDPVTSDVKLFYLHVAADLAEFSDEELHEAAVQIRRTERDSKKFPSLGECLAACNKAKGTLAARKRAEASATRQPARNLDREHFLKKFAEDHLKHWMAEQASGEGWLVGFYEFCQEHGDLPSPEQVRNIKAASKSFREELHRSFNLEGLGGLTARRVAKALKERERMLKETVFSKENAA